MAHFEIDISELDQFSKAVLSAALKHARQHREIKTHILSLKDFYNLAGLGNEFYYENFMGLVSEVMKAAVCSPDYDEGILRCWPVFDSTIVTRARFEFTVNSTALDAVEFPIPFDQIRKSLSLQPRAAVNNKSQRPPTN